MAPELPEQLHAIRIQSSKNHRIRLCGLQLHKGQKKENHQPDHGVNQYIISSNSNSVEIKT